jgi:hypothetical protein
MLNPESGKPVPMLDDDGLRFRVCKQSSELAPLAVHS